MKWNPWLYPPVLGKALTQRAMCISGTKYLFVFSSDKWSGPQSLFIVTQSLGLIFNAFQAWKTFWWSGIKLYICIHTHTHIYVYVCVYIHIYVYYIYIHIYVYYISISISIYIYMSVQFSSVQSLSRVWLFATPWTAAGQASLSIIKSQSLPKPVSIESVMASNHLILCRPLPLLPSIPASGSFQMSQLFPSGGQCIEVSASTSVLSRNIQDWSPIGCTGWNSLQSKGLSRIFYNTTVQNHQFLRTQLSL